MLLSIIIPCYNVEGYIEDCLNSIYSNVTDVECFEVIAINDGSVDLTEEILVKWQKIKKNFNFISQNNSGVSKARNVGIDTAKGEYIWFIDADDFLKPNTINHILNILSTKHPEYVLLNHQKVGCESHFDINDKTEEFSYDIIYDNYSSSNVWSSIFKNKNIHFCEELKYAEDTYYSYLQYLEREDVSQGCVKIKTPVYCYRMNPNGASQSKNINAITRHTTDLFLLGLLYLQKNKSGDILEQNKIDNTKTRQYTAIQGGLTLLPNTNLNLDKTLIELKKYGLYPYPLITWTFKSAKSISAKITELVKMTFRFEFCYRLYYKIRKLKKH